MKRLFLAAAFALTATAAHAACNPSDAPPNSVGCQPALPSAVQATDLFLGWRPSLGKTASRTITPAQLLQAGLPGGFSSLSASGSATVLGTLTVGDTTPLTGGSKFFRFGYGATNPLVTMQSAGTDSTGAAQQVLSISQQVTHTGAGGAGAIGALYSASTIDGAPYQDYYAAAFTMTNRALRLGGATPDQAQHGTLFTHQVKALPTAGFNPGDVMADSWVQWWVMQDRTNLPSSQGGALVGVEFDIFGNNQDDAPTKKRFARQVVLNNYASDAAHPLEWGYGDYWNSFTGGAQDTFFNVVSAYYAGWTVAAIDLSQGTGSRANPYVDATNRGVDIKMRDGGKLGFNGDGATGSYMTHGTSRFQYWAGGSERASISDTGVGIIGGGTAPFTLSNGTLSVPTSQNIAIQLASAGTSISLGATSAGLGNALTVAVASGGNAAQTASPNNVTIGNLLTSKFLLSSPGTITWSGSTTSGDTYNPFRMTGVTHTGTSSGSEIYLNLLNIAGTDNINATAGKVVGWRFNHNVAAGANGTRNGLHYSIATTGATTNMLFLTAANFFSAINHSTGGTAYSQAGVVGAAFGLNSYATIASGVDYIREAVSYEADISVRNAGGVFRKVGIQVVADSLDAGKGVSEDHGLLFGTQGGGAGFLDAIAVGGVGSQFPLYTTGMTSILRAYYGFGYTSHSPRTYWGVNLIEADVAGWAFASQGFSVNGSGSVQIGTGLMQAVSDGLKVGAPGAVASAAAVSAGGSNYTVNDILYDSDGAGGTYGGIYKVATLAGSACATVTILKAPFVPGAAPANPIATTTWQTTTQGTGCTLNLTWGTGGNVTVGTGSAIATNATTGFLKVPTMAGAPTGAVGAAGQAAVVIDTTNNKICWSTGGGTWKCALGS